MKIGFSNDVPNNAQIITGLMELYLPSNLGQAACPVRDISKGDSIFTTTRHKLGT